MYVKTMTRFLYDRSKDNFMLSEIIDTKYELFVKVTLSNPKFPCEYRVWKKTCESWLMTHNDDDNLELRMRPKEGEVH